MNAILNKRISLYKELKIRQESPRGGVMIYTCYEAIPNGGFCIISADPDTDKEQQLAPAVYIKSPFTSIINGVELEFYPTLIDAINAYTGITNNAG